VSDGKQVILLPGFPTLGDVHLTRHDRAGLRGMAGHAAAFGRQVSARLPVRIAYEIAAPNSSWCRGSGEDGLIGTRQARAPAPYSVRRRPTVSEKIDARGPEPAGSEAR